MIIKIKVTPIKVEAPSKDALMSRISQDHVLTFSETGNGYTQFGSRTTTKIRVYNAHKINKKVKQLRDKEGKYTGRKIISNAKWIAYVYEFPVSLLKETNMRVDQSSRNFKLSKVNR